MEFRTEKGFVIDTYTDEVMGVTWVKFLNQKTLESLKLPQIITKYKHANIIKYPNILIVELIKTRKNWILKDIVTYTKLTDLDKYTDFVKYSEILRLIKKYVYTDQEVEIIDFLTDFFTKDFNVRTIEEFESKLLNKLGFSQQLEFNQQLTRNLHQNKIDSGLV